MTEIIKADQFKEGAALLKKGELVAFPTETVFGLGAVANNEEAVKQVYQVKGRPSDNPLIVHISRAEDIFTYAADMSAEKVTLITTLIKVFWPGPLTLIVPTRVGMFGPVVTGGLTTVGIRMPDHQATLNMITATGFPIVGPSANISGKPSPTQSKHVYHDFNGKIAGILDSEPTRVGVESTVLDVSSSDHKAHILRPGAVTASMLRQAVPDLEVQDFEFRQLDDAEVPKAPGMKYRHYSPNLPVYAVSTEKIEYVIASLKGKNIGLAASNQLLENMPTVNIKYKLGSSIAEFTHGLFDALRTFDDNPELDIILVQLLDDKEENQAYRNRLLKASSKVFE